MLILPGWEHNGTNRVIHPLHTILLFIAWVGWKLAFTISGSNYTLIELPSLKSSWTACGFRVERASDPIMSSRVSDYFAVLL